MPRFRPVTASESLFAVLAEAKRDSIGWEDAWFLGMEALRPPRSSPKAMRNALAEERALLQETKPWWQAAYEGREVLADEFEQVQARSERRLDQLASA